MRTAPWIQTWSGQAIDILCPSASAMRLVDIATSLSAQARFNGHTRFVWSVAGHSLLTEKLLPTDVDPEARLHVLLHDAHEMVTGDIVSPMRTALAEMAGADLIAYAAQRIQTQIHHAAGVRCDERMRELTKLMDLTALALEKRDLLRAGDLGPWPPLPDVSGYAMELTPELARTTRARFIRRFRDLLRESDVLPMRSFLEGT